MGRLLNVDTIELFMFDVGNYRAFPKVRWKRIRTANMVERANAEIKLRTKIIGAFPSCESLSKLIESILIDINEEWVRGIRYLDIIELLHKQILDAESRVCSSAESPVVSIKVIKSGLPNLQLYLYTTVGCRLDAIKRYLSQLKNPHPHTNFYLTDFV